MCYPAGASASQLRTLSAETIRALSAAYKHSPSANLKGDLDQLISQMYSKPGTGGLNPDGQYVNDLDDITGSYLIGTPPLGTAPKWFGEFFGFPNTGDWAASRTGGLAAPALRSYTISFDLTQVPGAQQAMVNITSPDGSVTQTTCPQSPCTLQVNATLGNPLLTIQYLSVDNIPLALAQPFVVQVL
jgi:hypothetical protein